MTTEQQMAEALEGKFFRVPNPDRTATSSKPQRRIWTPADREKLIQMYHAGKTYDFMSNALDYERGRISDRIRELMDEDVLTPRRRPG